FQAERQPGGGASGVIPFPLFGDWTLGSIPAESCTASVHADTLTASCGPYVGESPRWAPPVAGENLTATRTEPRASIFGDLGGTWQVTTSENATCVVTIQGSDVDCECHGAGMATGTLHFSY